MEMFEDMDDLAPPTLRKPLIDVENLYIVFFPQEFWARSPETLPGWAMSRNGHRFDEAEEVNRVKGVMAL